MICLCGMFAKKADLSEKPCGFFEDLCPWFPFFIATNVSVVYNLNPVRHQAGSYGKGFRNHSVRCHTWTNLLPRKVFIS